MNHVSCFNTSLYHIKSSCKSNCGATCSGQSAGAKTMRTASDGFSMKRIDYSPGLSQETS